MREIHTQTDRMYKRETEIRDPLIITVHIRDKQKAIPDRKIDLIIRDMMQIKEVRTMRFADIAKRTGIIQQHNRNIPEHIKIPDTRFHHVHIDIIGSLPVSQRYRYCLTAIDRFTRWPEATAMSDISADTIAMTFYASWVARFGALAVIISDRGSQFESTLFQALIKLLVLRPPKFSQPNDLCTSIKPVSA